ncbi:hypothetical protein LCI18_010873 [Fusarium solani-melongenae]|uniref:Uncharacterized protein n=1 Tax=Fusarium solani subsp. cucurbitae TaxID=2747967 RepID=A0ACD3ZF47_FUSSC|nr:hypothetical protein LCI18_010873 [Fusarium solani-melongenae]
MRPKRACDVCYKRKIQCVIENADKPCEWCSHHGLSCTFDRETQKKSNNVQAIAGDVQELLRRVLDLEKALFQIQSQGQLSDQTSPCSMPSTTPGAIQYASTQGITPSSLGGQTSQTLPSSVASPSETPTTFKPHTRDIGDVARYLGQNWYHKGIPILSERGRDWVRLKTGQDAQFERFHMFGSKRSFPALPLTNLSYHELHKLPDRLYAESCLDAFFGSSISLFYPVLDRELVQETLEVAYQDHTNSSFTCSRVSAKACILAALCMITRTVRPKDASKQPQGDLYVDQVKSLLALASWEACIEGLQATLMLQICKISVGEWEEASTLHSIACHMVCSLGGHLNQRATCDSSRVVSEQKLRHIRTLFWMSYIFDKDISLRSGQPPLLTEDYCNLTAPEGYANRYDCQAPSDQDTSTFGRLVPYLPGDLGLSHVKEKACRLLYSPKSFTVDDTQILLHIRHLDIDLESWRSSIPAKYRPKLSVTPGGPLFDSEMNSLQRIRCLHLQLEYHYLVTAIHTAVRRCGAAYAEAPNLPDDLHSVFHSSSDLSLEASRSTLTLLKGHINLLEEEAFWRVAFYPPVAAMSLFINILIHPVDPRGQVDLGILASAISIFQTTSVQSLTTDDIDYLQEMNNFAAELVRLGNLAIWKAKKEENRESSDRELG